MDTMIRWLTIGALVAAAVFTAGVFVAADDAMLPYVLLLALLAAVPGMAGLYRYFSGRRPDLTRAAVASTLGRVGILVGVVTVGLLADALLADNLIFDGLSLAMHELVLLGVVGGWLVLVNVAGWRSRRLPRGLAAVGIFIGSTLALVTLVLILVGGWGGVLGVAFVPWLGGVVAWAAGVVGWLLLPAPKGEASGPESGLDGEPATK